MRESGILMKEAVKHDLTWPFNRVLSRISSPSPFQSAVHARPAGFAFARRSSLLRRNVTGCVYASSLAADGTRVRAEPRGRLLPRGGRGVAEERLWIYAPRVCARFASFRSSDTTRASRSLIRLFGSRGWLIGRHGQGFTRRFFWMKRPRSRDLVNFVEPVLSSRKMIFRRGELWLVVNFLSLFDDSELFNTFVTGITYAISKLAPLLAIMLLLNLLNCYFVFIYYCYVK